MGVGVEYILVSPACDPAVSWSGLVIVASSG